MTSPKRRTKRGKRATLVVAVQEGGADHEAEEGEEVALGVEVGVEVVSKP
jgi:hypothetical protein